MSYCGEVLGIQLCVDDILYTMDTPIIEVYLNDNYIGNLIYNSELQWSPGYVFGEGIGDGTYDAGLEPPTYFKFFYGEPAILASVDDSYSPYLCDLTQMSLWSLPNSWFDDSSLSAGTNKITLSAGGLALLSDVSGNLGLRMFDYTLNGGNVDLYSSYVVGSDSSFSLNEGQTQDFYFTLDSCTTTISPSTTEPPTTTPEVTTTAGLSTGRLSCVFFVQLCFQEFDYTLPTPEIDIFINDELVYENFDPTVSFVGYGDGVYDIGFEPLEHYAYFYGDPRGPLVNIDDSKSPLQCQPEGAFVYPEFSIDTSMLFVGGNTLKLVAGSLDTFNGDPVTIDGSISIRVFTPELATGGGLKLKDAGYILDSQFTLTDNGFEIYDFTWKGCGPNTTPPFTTTTTTLPPITSWPPGTGTGTGTGRPPIFTTPSFRYTTIRHPLVNLPITTTTIPLTSNPSLSGTGVPPPTYPPTTLLCNKIGDCKKLGW